MRNFRLLPIILALFIGLGLLWTMTVMASQVPSKDQSSTAVVSNQRTSSLLAQTLDTINGSGIILTKTVGTDPSLCATTDDITVTIGTEVIYCYTVTNNTAVALDYHTVEDTDLGVVLNQFPYALAPGASTFITQSSLPFESTTNMATWTAENPAAYDLITGTCTFPDISSTGTPLNLSDDQEVDLLLPFLYPYYNRLTDQITVSNNGVVVLDAPGANVSFVNQPLPTSNLLHAIVPFWDDLDSETGNVYVGLYTYTLALENDLLAMPTETAQGATSYYVVQWDERSHFPGPSSSTVTFAIGMIAPGQGLDGYMFFCYPDTTFDDPALDYGASATIGINSGGSIAEQFSYNTAHPELTGTFGMGFIPLGGGQAHTAVDTAHVTVLLQTYLPAVLSP